MNLEERWKQIEMGIKEEMEAIPIQDGHIEVNGGSEQGLEAENDELTKPEAGETGESGSSAEIYTEAGGGIEGGSIIEVEGFEKMLQEPIIASEVMEIIHGKDDRVRVTNTIPYPWRTICHLEITAADGRSFIGSGSFIGPRVVLTAGHCIYLHSNGGWARSIKVIPGRNGSSKPYSEAVGTFYYSVKGWTNNKDSSHDYGVIVLPSNKKLGNTVGWMGLANLSFLSLIGLNVNTSGYPGDKTYGTQWWNSNNIMAVTGHKIYYKIDTMGGQSGSPVWRYKDGNRHIIAIHTTGGSPFNSATRINSDVFNNLKNWKDL